MTLYYFILYYGNYNIFCHILPHPENSNICLKSPDLKKKKVGGEDGKSVKKLELIPIVNISKKITSQMLKDIKSGKWLEKKEECENIEKMLENANMKILPNGLMIYLI